MLKALIKRETMRFFAGSQVWFLCIVYYGVLASFFRLVVSSQSGPQPQLVSPLQLVFSGGYIILLWVLFLPVITLKSFAEERSAGTWDNLCCTGVKIESILISKFIVAVYVLVTMLFVTLPIPILMFWGGSLDGMAVVCSYFGILLLGIHCLSLCYFIACKSSSMISTFIFCAIALVLYWALPYLRMLLDGPLWQIVFERIDLSRMLKKTSQGFLISQDIIYLLSGSVFFLSLTYLRLVEFGKGLKLAARLRWLVVLIFISFSFYLIQFISSNKAVVWHFSKNTDLALSKEYKRELEKFPQNLKVSVLLPKQLEIETYQETREMILKFLELSSSYVQEMKIEIIDPDFDLLKMERIMRKTTFNNSQIGGILIELDGKQSSIAYHQWVTLETITHESKPIRFVKAFHGEQQLTSAVNRLLRKNKQKKVCVLTGQGELDLNEKSRLGGYQFALAMVEFGFKVKILNPLTDNIKVTDFDLIMSIDSQNNLPAKYLQIINRCRENSIPLLVSKGILNANQKERWEALKEYGLIGLQKIIYQNKYENTDPLSIPIRHFSDHPISKQLKGLTVFQENSMVFKQFSSIDPNISVLPFARTEKAINNIWGENNIESTLSNKEQHFNYGDIEGPFVSGYVAEKNSSVGKKPILVLLNSRAMFENRFIKEGANNNLVMGCIEYLLSEESPNVLVPVSPHNYRMYIHEKVGINVFRMILLSPLFLIFCLLIRKSRQFN
jgi:ABC-2 type transport system permease protein